MQNHSTVKRNASDGKETNRSGQTDRNVQPAPQRVAPFDFSEQRPLIFGEILFDTFDDGMRVLGGAAFNVAWNLRGFGLNPLMVSCIGQDEPGSEILEKMTHWGMDTSGVQIHPEYETGKVDVQVRDGQPSYSIKPDQAYDHIDAPTVLDGCSGGSISCLYHGSLALRDEHNRNTLQQLKSHFSPSVLLDLNLREPWWTQEIVDTCMQEAKWAKLNQDELVHITQTQVTTATELNQLGLEVLNRYALSGLLITRGSEGATWLSESEPMISVPAAPVERMVDTVGAGDAFCSVLMTRLLLGWKMPDCLERASRFASTICGLQGATSTDPAVYTHPLSQWQKEES